MADRKRFRQHLDITLRNFIPLAEAAPPDKGWIRMIRNALGMTSRQLGNRLGIAQQAVSRIEKHELSGRVTIKTLNRMGDALDCRFVYGFVPRTSLEETVARQARQVAMLRLEQATQSIGDKKQALTKEEKEKVIADLADALIQTLPSTFWDIQE